jgi:peptide-methionine (S)-S-oxide reductase
MAAIPDNIGNNHNPALDPDTDAPDNPGHEFAQFGAGCFWGVELAFQRVVGVVRTEVGYSQGHDPDPNYKLVCSGTTNHVEVVRVQFDPEVCPYTNLLSLFWARHDPTTLDRQVSLPMISFFSFLFFQLCGVMGKMSCLLK